MKISQLVSGIGIAITNEEQTFVDRHGSQIRLNSLDDHDHWTAQNLVRKGIYAVSSDHNTLIKKTHES